MFELLGIKCVFAAQVVFNGLQCTFKMLKVGTLVLYKNDSPDEQCLGVVTGGGMLLADIVDEDDVEDYYRETELAGEVYPVKWFDMKGICNEQPENLIIVSEVK